MNANRACGPLLSLDCWRYSDRSIDRWNKQKLTRIITKWLDLDRKKKFVFSNFLLNDILIEEFMRNWARIKWSRTCTESYVHASFKGFLNAKLLSSSIFTTVNIYLVEFCVHCAFNQHVQQHNTFSIICNAFSPVNNIAAAYEKRNPKWKTFVFIRSHSFDSLTLNFNSIVQLVLHVERLWSTKIK